MTARLNVTIRKAVIEDCGVIMELIHELAAFEKAPEQVTVTFDHFVESGFGQAPVWWAFVAETGGKIVGFALYYVRYSTWKGQRLYLEDLLVTAPMRGKGIGSLLFEQVMTECKEKNYSGMMWQVLDWNEPALRFYKKYNAGLDAEWINGSINFA